MANGDQNFGFEDLFPAGLPEGPTGGFRPLFDPVQKAEQVAVAAAEKKQTLIERAGFRADSPIGGALNLGASVASGLSRDVIGRLATLPIDAIGAAAQNSVPEDVTMAYNRMLRDEATPEDLVMLNQTAPFEDGVPQTYQQRLEGAKGVQDVGQKVADFFDISSIVDQTDRERLSRDIRESTAEGVENLRHAVDLYNTDGNVSEAAKVGIKGLGQTVGNALASGVTSPGAIAEYTLENTPQLAAAMASPLLAVATNVGYGADIYRKSMTDYVANNNGQLPDNDEIRQAAGWAAAATLAEQVGDVAAIRAITGAGRKGVVGGAASIAGSGAKEGVTEGFQTYAEAKAAFKDPTIEEVVEGATIGALVGANFQGGAVVTAGAGNREAAVLQNQQNKESADEAFAAAVQTGDVSALADPNLETYDPVRAIDALNQVSVGAPAEVVQTNLAQVDSIQQTLTQQVSEVEARLDLGTAEGVQETRDLLEAMTAAGASQADVDFVTAELAAQEAYGPEQRAADETRLTELQGQLKSVQEAGERMRVDSSPEQAAVQAMAANAEAGDVQSANSLLTLTMTNPDAVDTQVADALAQSEALSVPQRTALARFSEAQVAANALKGRTGVRSDIATGGDGFKGIPQYRNAIRMALATGNTDVARSQVDGITSFAASRASKLDVITAAYEQVKGTNNSINIVRDQFGNWGPTDLKGKALKTAGGLVIDARSFKLRDDVSAELDVLQKTASAFAALVDAAPTPAETAAVQPSAAGQGEVTAPAVETADAAPVMEAETAPASVDEANVAEEVQTEETVADPAPQDAGQLSAIQNRTGAPVTAANYTAVNLVGELFTQTPGNEEAVSVRPLVAVPGFMSAIRAGEVNYQDYLGQEGPLSGPQQAALGSFTSFARYSEQAIRDVFKVTATRAKRPDFFYRDMAQFLQNADGQIDENLATAVSFGMFSWVNENATQLRNSDEAINAILLRDLDSEITSAEYAALSTLGTRESVVASQLGGRIVQALGLRPTNQGTDAELSKLEASIGARALGAMANLGLIQREQISDVKLQALMKSGEPGNKNMPHTFVRIKAAEVDGKMVADPLITRIRERNTGSQSVLAKVFGVEAAGVEPSYQPVPFDQKFAKRTKQDVPKVLAEALEKEGARAHTVRQNMWHIWGRLSKDALYVMGGAVSTTDAPTHVENVASRNAKSDGIRQQVDNFDAFIKAMVGDVTTDGLEQKLYFGRSVWKPQRVGLTANVVNPQTSKIHRHMMAMEGWGAEVRFDDPAMIGNFKLRVLEAFGVKTEADLTTNVLTGYEAKVNDPAIQAGINALVDILRDNNVPTNESAIVDAVAAAGENFHSFDALVALAEQRIAEQDGAPSFTTSMMGEVDGLTNGPMLSIAMLGAKGWDTLVQGGFFPMDSQYTQFNEYKADGGLDLYESNIAASISRLQGRDATKLAALQVITGQLATDEGKVTKKGRNAIKKPLTALMFGSNPTTAVQGMAEGFIDSIYSKMEGAAANRSQAEMVEIVRAVNALIPSKGLHMSESLGYDVVLNTRLSHPQKDAIMKTFYELLGEPTEKALADTYATFIARRNTINQTAQLAFQVFNAVRDGVIEHVTNNSEQVPRNVGGDALRTLTREQQAEVNRLLGDMAPILQTAMSQASDQREAGMYMAKSQRTMDSSKPFESEVAFGAPVETIGMDGQMKGIGSSKVSAATRGDVDPGVMPFITSIHSMDSSIASTVYASIEALNVHDALGVDLNNMEKVGQELNKATFDNLMNYSSATAMSNMFDQVLTGAARLLQDEAISSLVSPRLRQVADARKAKKQGNIEQQVEQIRHVAREADTDKLSMLADMNAVGQYATEGGSYMVTEADRAAARKKLAEVGSSFNAASTAIAEQLDFLGGIVADSPSFGRSVQLIGDSLRTLAPATSLNSLDSVMKRAEGQLAADVQQTIADMQDGQRTLGDALAVLPEARAADVVAAVAAVTGPKLSVWGQLGQPVVQSNADMVQLLESTPDMTARQLAEALIAYVQDPFQRTVLQMARRSLPESVKVRYVTSETGPEGAFGEGVDKSRGWYAQRAGSAAVFVKSPEFVESGITPEMLTHELVHTALANLVDQHTGKQTVTGRAVAELELIRISAAEFIGNNGALSAKYRNATSNVHELLAWGLTNQDFQREVLAATNAPTRDTGLLQNLQKFIRKITAMLFNGSVRDESAMAALVAQSAGLFREAAAQQSARDTSTLKYEDAVDHVNAMTAVQVFDNLDSLPGVKTDPTHAGYLRDLLEQTVEPLYGPYGAFKEQAKKDMSVTPLDVFLKAVQTGNMPFSSAATHNAFIVNQQEAFVLESVEAVVQDAMTNPNTVFVRAALENLFNEARKTLNPNNFHPGDWATASQNEKDVAEAKYAFLFRPVQNIGAKHSYLSRFAALGLASQEVRNVLGFGTANAEQPLKSLPWASRITELFRRVMTRLASLHTKVTTGMAGNQALTTLVGQLVDIEAKRKHRLSEKAAIGIDQIEAYLAGAAGTAREKLDALGQSPFMRNSRIPGFKLAGVAMSTLAGERLESMLDHVTRVRDHEQKSTHGLMMGLLTEWRGVYDSRRLAAELFKGAKAIEKDRKDMIENTVANVNASFADGGANLSQEQRDAITKVFLKTNMTALASARGFDGMRVLLEDNVARQAAREQLEREVKATSSDYLYMLGQTKDLAHHRVVGGSTSPNLMQSTANITAMFGTKKAGAVQPNLVPLLDQLLALYAFEYSGDLDKRHALQVLRTESNRTDGNGIDFVLKLHAGLQAQSKDQLFRGTESLQMTGYTPEIHDNKIEVLLVSPKDVAAHLRAGYEVGTNLQRDPNFKTPEQRVLMTRRGAGQTAILTGAMSFTGMSARGSSPVTEAKNMMFGNQTTNAKVRSEIAKGKAQAIDALFTRGMGYDPRKAQAGHMAPTLAPDGKIADYRHLMTEHNRDVLLDRDSSMDQVLGVMAGQIVDKVSSAQQNADVVGSLYDQYRADYNNRPSSYLQVGPGSSDPQIAEMYRLLPEATKREIQKVWKSDTLYVPADQINMILGYRKFSATNAFAALPTDRNLFEKTLVSVAGAVFGAKAELRIGQAEDIAQTLVREAKDILVVKNIFTLVGNIMSNMTVLAWEGVPLKSAAASHAVAIKGALDYRKDAKRLAQLTQSVEIGYTANTADVEAEIVALRDRLARNPVKPLVDAGLMPTIVEDVEVNDDRYSYQSVLGRKVERFTSKVPSWLREAGKQVYMTHDTGTYKFLSQATQLSDLVARYAMYTHATTRAKDPMSQADALQLAEDSFVNYDLPSHRTLQYMNDMGVVMFTKYYLRIQKVIMRLVKERPARGLMLAAVNHYIAGMQSIMDSSWINKIGNNPLQWGPFGYVGALDELPAIKLMD